MNMFEKESTLGKLFRRYPSFRVIYEIYQKDVADSAIIMNFEILVTFNKQDIDKRIDDIIEEAINEERHEFVAYLLDYKKKNNLYTPSNWDI